MGMTEPDAGSATTDLKTTATPDGEGFRVNGSKVFPNPHADMYLVYVRYGPTWEWDTAAGQAVLQAAGGA